MNLSLLELWHSMGGFAKGIVVVLATMSLLMVTTGLGKWWRIRRSMKRYRAADSADRISSSSAESSAGPFP